MNNLLSQAQKEIDRAKQYLQEQREKEIAQEKADNETLLAIIKKYGITSGDVCSIKNTIYSLKGDF